MSNNKNKYWVVIDRKKKTVQFYDNLDAFQKEATGKHKEKKAFKNENKAIAFLQKWQDKLGIHEDNEEMDRFIREHEEKRPKGSTSTKYWVVYDSLNHDVWVYTDKEEFKKNVPGKGKIANKFANGVLAFRYVKECEEKIHEAEKNAAKPKKYYVVVNNLLKTAMIYTDPKKQKEASYKVAGATSRCFKTEAEALNYKKQCEEAFDVPEEKDVPKKKGKQSQKCWVVYDHNNLTLQRYFDQSEYLKAIDHRKGLVMRAFKSEGQAQEFITKCEREIARSQAIEDTIDDYIVATEPYNSDVDWDACYEELPSSYEEAIDDLITHDEEQENEEINDTIYEAYDQEKSGFKRHMIAFVDGSYSGDMYGYGAVMITPDGLHQLSGSGNAPELTELKNVAGELMAVTNVINCAQIRGYTSLTISYDFAGIEKYLDGKNKNPLIQGYASYVAAQRQFMDISFCKVKAHSSNFLNDLADKLAKRAAKQANNMRVAID